MEDSSAVFKVLLFLTFSLHLSSADTHSLQYLHTLITPGINFTAVGLLDGEQCVSYDCKTKEMIPKIQWIQKISVDEPHYWNIQTLLVKNHQEHLHNIVDTVMRNLNQNEGVHTLQRMYSCELHDDSTTRGYDQYAYDGEDFISLDLNTGTWTADNDKAVIFIKQWDPTGDEAQYWKDYLKNSCIDQLKKFVSYGRETLKKKVPPTASVFQKHSPSPEVVCHATGFFPKAVNITWRKDGEDVNEDVELRETLPNQDGSFQKRSILKVPAEDLQKHTYTCVIQHSSLKEELVLNVNEQQITKGEGSDGWKTGVIVAVVIVAVLVPGVVFWKKKKGSGEQSPQVHTGAQLQPLNVLNLTYSTVNQGRLQFGPRPK
ncbi:H-2 class I histocompatibility antigen, Q9 alpha chain-like [Hemibagrus wyckioides]|uniref:H-2 class I histocompatibility antigen, Q9 alpha chain-like n=1 Tax=Hemibagrus wyckioides TaxID=337641 RepID=UPI00266CED72|nr:H-2 class I histocompatibility antigen, Q9 alpha chain-like [Hemibagrus wyckioides]